MLCYCISYASHANGSIPGNLSNYRNRGVPATTGIEVSPQPVIRRWFGGSRCSSVPSHPNAWNPQGACFPRAPVTSRHAPPHHPFAGPPTLGVRHRTHRGQATKQTASGSCAPACCFAPPRYRAPSRCFAPSRYTARRHATAHCHATLVIPRHA